MTQREKENFILEKLVKDLSKFNGDHLKMLTDICNDQNKIGRWKQSRDILNDVENDFNDFLLVRSGREPIFGSLENGVE